MEFSITRASDWSDKAKPCEGAAQAGDEEWTIEISSLEELLALSKEVGAALIVSNGNPPNIWIYDDYME